MLTGPEYHNPVRPFSELVLFARFRDHFHDVVIGKLNKLPAFITDHMLMMRMIECMLIMRMYIRVPNYPYQSGLFHKRERSIDCSAGLGDAY